MLWAISGATQEDNWIPGWFPKKVSGSTLVRYRGRISMKNGTPEVNGFFFVE